MSDEEIEGVAENAAEAQRVAVEAAQEARALLLKVALRVGVETADVAIANGLSIARVERFEDTADGTRWSLQALYSADGAIMRLVGQPLAGMLAATPENVARVMGTAEGAFDFTLPLDYLRLARQASDDSPVARLVPARPDLAERVNELWMELVEGSIPRASLDVLSEAREALAGGA